jgi:malate:Na+ symporter
VIPICSSFRVTGGERSAELFGRAWLVMLGSLTAIVLAGTLNFVGKRYPRLTGEGRLQPGEHDDMDMSREDTEDEKGEPIDVGTVAAAGLAAITD